jgi:uncharacterized membrane protein
MVYLPATLPFVLLLIFLLMVFAVLVELQVLAYAYRKIGVRPRYVFVVMLLPLIGSHVNIPLYSIPVERLAPPHVVWMYGRAYLVPEQIQAGATVVAINVGGALTPMLLSLYLLVRTRLYWHMLFGIAIVALIVNRLAQIVPGVGIVVPMFLPPLVAAGVGLLLALRRAPPVAYVSGTMGALLGADVMNLGRIADLGAPVVAIGGAGVFDGIFLTGIIAGLLA